MRTPRNRAKRGGICPAGGGEEGEDELKQACLFALGSALGQEYMDVVAVFILCVCVGWWVSGNRQGKRQEHGCKSREDEIEEKRFGCTPQDLK